MEVKANVQPGEVAGPLDKACGFTLIEMLLAITIFSMVVGIIFSSFRLGSRAWEKGEKGIDQFQRIRAVSELCYRAIRSSYPYTITPSELDTHKRFYAFFGESDSLKIITSANLHRISGGLSLLEFWLEEGKGLLVGENRALATNLEDLRDIELRDEENSAVIDPNIAEIHFRYFDRKRKEEQGEWVTSWDPKDKTGRDIRLPRFVEVSLTFDIGNEKIFKEQLIVPLETTVYNP
jgi:general secretion pathway protein J